VEVVVQARRPLFWIFCIFCTITVHSNELPRILLFTPDGEIFNQTIRGMKNEFDGSYSLEIAVTSDETTEKSIGEIIVSTSPQAVVLMGNRAIKLYKMYTKTNPDKNGSIPVVALLASQVEKATNGLKNINGIAYETPMITALVNFRAIFGTQLDNVGVIYRDVFKKFVQQHTEYSKREKINIKSILIGNDITKYKREIGKALKQLVLKDKVDVFWLPNDNKLLKTELLVNTWIPMFLKHNIPIIVGVEALVIPENRFGTYAVIPEPMAMGEQAAQIIFDLEETGWKFAEKEFFPAISVYSVLNMAKLSGISTEKLNLKEVTKILK
jgi:hypothetical protein